MHSAKEAGVEDSVVMRLGRWQSAAWLAYWLQSDRPSMLKLASQAMWDGVGTAGERRVAFPVIAVGETSVASCLAEGDDVAALEVRQAIPPITLRRLQHPWKACRTEAWSRGEVQGC